VKSFFASLGLFWKNYFNFRGRTPRRGYWHMVIFHAVVYLILGILGIIDIFTLGATNNGYEPSPLGWVSSIAMLVYFVATYIPNLALTIRRLHDTGKRWFMVIFKYAPLLILLILLVVIVLTSGLSLSENFSFDDFLGLHIVLLVAILVFAAVNLASRVFMIILMARNTRESAIGECTHGSPPFVTSGTEAPQAQWNAGAGAAEQPAWAAETGVMDAAGGAGLAGSMGAMGAMGAGGAQGFQQADPYYPAHAQGAGSMYQGAHAAGAGAGVAGAAGAGQVATIVGVRGMYAGYPIPVQAGETLIFGRDSSISSVVVNQGAEKVSRRHCAISFDAAQQLYYVTDYSSNGTYCEDGFRLPPNNATPVSRGTVLNLGSAENSFRLA
jgi:uncharacterized membrane protein YhaH (DUF805 family)